MKEIIIKYLWQILCALIVHYCFQIILQNLVTCLIFTTSYLQSQNLRNACYNYTSRINMH